MSSYRSKYTKYFRKYKDLTRAFGFLKWTFNNTVINGQTYELEVPKCGPQEIVITDGVTMYEVISVTTENGVTTIVIQ